MVQIFIFLTAGYFLSGPKNCFELPLTKTKFGRNPPPQKNASKPIIKQMKRP